MSKTADEQREEFREACAEFGRVVWRAWEPVLTPIFRALDRLALRLGFH